MSDNFFQSLDKTHQTRLKKLKITSLLDFIISHVPKAYIDTTLSTSLVQNHIGVFRIYIDELSTSGFGNKALLKIKALMSDFNNEALQMIIFHPKAFHKKLFTPHAHIYVMGKLEYRNYQYSIIQPRVITQINHISLRFKTTLLPHKIMQELSQSIVNLQNLKHYHIPLDIAQKICTIFSPDSIFCAAFNAQNMLPQDYLDALKFVEIYQHLSRLRAKKTHFKAAHKCDNDSNDFIKSLPFALTQGQIQAIEDIKNDLTKDKAARRLIMGDVGCGKTIVVLAAVMMAYPQTSILMAPTTILAKQLYEEAKQLLPHYVRIYLITAKSKNMPEEEKEAHFIIGTQALLYRELELNNLALVMSDEQHRFGTNQRYILEKIGTTKAVDSMPSLFPPQNPHKNAHSRPHVLQFSATPIPRTLAMINANLIDMSIIKDMPFQKDISTIIISKPQFKAMFAHLQEEISKGNQAIIVYPLVEESEHLDYLSLSEGLGFWQKHFDNVYCTSGKDKNKTQIISDFAKNGSLLLATTLIEVGLSLPRVSVIVIVAPERLGLATLHQLRGRVSRNGLKGYCYLYTQKPDNERLNAFCKTLSGFDIAELDLKYRHSGDLLSGERQSGDEFMYFDISNDREILQNAQSLLNRL